MLIEGRKDNSTAFVVSVETEREALRKPHSYVYKVEHGERRIDPVEFVQWCRACGVDPADEVDRIKP